MTNKENLRKANKAKNDEFYTQLSDIEAELQYYEKHFKDKIVYCNCDNPEWSNFWKYFESNFEKLGLKRLIATYYDNDKQVYRTDLINDTKNKPHGVWITKIPLKGNGDFRSQECIDILKEADIVITNPPFSLFREYAAQLMEYEKKFLIIGSQNAITYKEFFPLLKDNKVWLGYNGVKQFIEPNGEVKKFGNICWYTNLETDKRNEPIKLTKYYNPSDYPKYDNYDAINVDKTKDIPMDYEGVMGVPISFMDKYCPEQFEIVGLGNSRENFSPNKKYCNPIKIKKDGSHHSGEAINCVLTLSQKVKPVNMVYYISNNSDYLVPPYARILIKRK